LIYANAVETNLFTACFSVFHPQAQDFLKDRHTTTQFVPYTLISTQLFEQLESSGLVLSWVFRGNSIAARLQQDYDWREDRNIIGMSNELPHEYHKASSVAGERIPLHSSAPERLPDAETQSLAMLRSHSDPSSHSNHDTAETPDVR